MIPNSDNSDLVAVTARPDWAKGVTTTLAFATQIFVSRTGKEQRQRDRLTPKARIAWQSSGLTLGEAKAALAQAEVEARAMCLVPFWSEGTVTVDSTDGDAVTIGVDPRPDFFQPGQYVFLDDGTASGFREIEAVTDRLLTLVADVSAPTFGAGAKIWPCRKCRRILADETLTRDNISSHTIKYTYETAAP